jgi:hypothetical protein
MHATFASAHRLTNYTHIIVYHINLYSFIIQLDVYFPKKSTLPVLRTKDSGCLGI